MVGDYLEAADARLPRDMFHRAAIRRVLGQHRSGEADHSSIIWLLLNYAAWYDLYIRRGTAQAARLKRVEVTSS